MFRHLKTDLLLLGKAGDYEDILGAFAAALQLLGSRLLPDFGASPVDAIAAARPELQDFVYLLGMLADPRAPRRSDVNSFLDQPCLINSDLNSVAGRHCGGHVPTTASFVKSGDMLSTPASSPTAASITKEYNEAGHDAESNCSRKAKLGGIFDNPNMLADLEASMQRIDTVVDRLATQTCSCSPRMELVVDSSRVLDVVDYDGSTPTGLTNKQMDKQGFDAIRIISSWRPLPDVQWQQIYSSFPPHRAHALVRGPRIEQDLRESWGNEPISLPAGSVVMVHVGCRIHRGKILRRGFGRFSDQYRVQFAFWNGTPSADTWMDCWRCTLAPARFHETLGAASGGITA